MAEGHHEAPSIEGVAFSLPKPGSLDPLLEVLGVNDEGQSLVVGDALQRRFGLTQGRAVIRHYRLGCERLDYVSFESVDTSSAADTGPANTLWFQHVAIVVSDMRQAAERLMPYVVPISDSPQWLPNGVAAWKFRNAAGHAMELLWFPPDQGHPRWHQPEPKLFQGLDHTAIAISDSDRSLAFYGVELGLQLRYATLNQGMEQQHLDALADVSVAIHGLSGSSPCGVEFLRYLNPSPKQPTAAALQPQDALYAQILLRASGADSGHLQCDPDGHRIWIHS